MAEMLYGNLGVKDASVNIDMDENLYRKLDMRLIQRIRPLLRSNAQANEFFFIYRGEVVEKSGSYSIYGFASKAEKDSRNGDFGHFVAVNTDTRSIAANFEDVRFLTEDGFIEYANMGTLNSEKRFSIVPCASAADISVKKAVAAQLLETGLPIGKGKRKCVFISAADDDVMSFSNKTVSFMADLIKYLPYGIRKKISFISRVYPGDRVPDTINLAAYIDDASPRMRDAVNIDLPHAQNSSIFSAFVDKIFDMNGSEREEYFTMLYEELEKPTEEAGAEFKTNLYLKDIEIKPLWAFGEDDDVIENMISSLDLIKNYPAYKKLALSTVASRNGVVGAFAQRKAAHCGSPEELRELYKSLTALCAVCDFDKTDVKKAMMNRVSELMAEKTSANELSHTVEAAKTIDNGIVDKDAAADCARKCIASAQNVIGCYNAAMLLGMGGFISMPEAEQIMAETVRTILADTLKKSDDLNLHMQILSREYEAFRRVVKPGSAAQTVNDVFNETRQRVQNNITENRIGRYLNELKKAENMLTGEAPGAYDIIGAAKIVAGTDINLGQAVYEQAEKVNALLTDQIYAYLKKYRDYAELCNITAAISPDIAIIEQRRTGSALGMQQTGSYGVFGLIGCVQRILAAVGNNNRLKDFAAAINDVYISCAASDMDTQSVLHAVIPSSLFRWFEMHPKEKVSAEGVEKLFNDFIKKGANEARTRDMMQLFIKSLKGMGIVPNDGFADKRKKGKSKLPLILILIGVIIVILATAAVLWFTIIRDRMAANDETASATETQAEETVNEPVNESVSMPTASVTEPSQPATTDAGPQSIPGGGTGNRNDRDRDPDDDDDEENVPERPRQENNDRTTNGRNNGGTPNRGTQNRSAVAHSGA